MTIPERMKRLDVDPRGYPIPWGVLRNEAGEPFFTVNDDRRQLEALRLGLCPLCGEKLGKWKWFAGGPRSAFDPNGWYLDLPGHHDCIQFALSTCPYLASPRYLGRIDIPHPEKLPPQARIMIDGTMIPERPELFVAVASSWVEAMERGLLAPYVRPGRPVLAYEYWRHGKQLSEVEALPWLLASDLKIPETQL